MEVSQFMPLYPVKKVRDFPVPSRDVTYQTLAGGNNTLSASEDMTQVKDLANRGQSIFAMPQADSSIASEVMTPVKEWDEKAFSIYESIRAAASSQ